MNLEVLDLRGNHINISSIHALSPLISLSSLKTLYLEGNKCYNEFIDFQYHVFSLIPSLLVLDHFTRPSDEFLTQLHFNDDSTTADDDREGISEDTVPLKAFNDVLLQQQLDFDENAADSEFDHREAVKTLADHSARRSLSNNPINIDTTVDLSDSLDDYKVDTLADELESESKTSNADNSLVYQDVEIKTLKTQLQAMEIAFSLQERALSQSQANTESQSSSNTEIQSFPFISLLQQWRRTVFEGIYSRLVLENEIKAFRSKLHKVSHASKQRERETEAYVLGLKERLAANHQLSESLQKHVEKLEKTVKKQESHCSSVESQVGSYQAAVKTLW